MNIKMLSDRKATFDGFAIIQYEEGKIYKDVDKSIALRFIAKKWAVKVEDEDLTDD